MMFLLCLVLQFAQAANDRAQVYANLLSDYGHLHKPESEHHTLRMSDFYSEVKGLDRWSIFYESFMIAAGESYHLYVSKPYSETEFTLLGENQEIENLLKSHGIESQRTRVIRAVEFESPITWEGPALQWKLERAFLHRDERKQRAFAFELAKIVEKTDRLPGWASHIRRLKRLRAAREVPPGQPSKSIPLSEAPVGATHIGYHPGSFFVSFLRGPTYFVVARTESQITLVETENTKYPGRLTTIDKNAWDSTSESGEIIQASARLPTENPPFDRILVQSDAGKWTVHRVISLIVTKNDNRTFVEAFTADHKSFMLSSKSPGKAFGILPGESIPMAIERFNRTAPAWQGLTIEERPEVVPADVRLSEPAQRLLPSPMVPRSCAGLHAGKK